MDEQGHQDKYSETSKTPPKVETTSTQHINARHTVLNDPALNLKRKFTLKSARTVDNHTLKDDKLATHNQIPDYIIKTLMIVNYHAREFIITADKDKNNEADSDSDSESEDEDSDNDMNIVGVDPMDALLNIFHCSDDFLRRDLAIKLSACQLSVPFLLPNPDAPSEKVTMLLWALESITKSWKGVYDNKESAQEVFATKYPFPVVSFIRIGKNTMSKSSLINKIMSDTNAGHNYFFHNAIKGGSVKKIKRKIVDGLVELSWYLPGGSEKQTLENEICFANLRGDARNFKKQLNILSKISSIFCVLLPSECPDEAVTRILEKVAHFKAKVILIFCEKNKESSKKYFNNLKMKHDKKLSLITKTKNENEYDFLQSIRINIQRNIHAVKAMPVAELAFCASECGIDLDVDQPHLGCDTSWLQMGAKGAKQLLKLQTHIPMLASLEREQHCPNRRGNKSESRSINDLIYKIDNDIEREKKAQKNTLQEMDKIIWQYFDYVVKMDATKRNYALTMLKHQLDEMSLQFMAKLHKKYRDAWLDLQKKKKDTRQKRSDALSPEEKHLKELEQSITECSFGLEHIIRELAQLHQLTADTNPCIRYQPIQIPDYAGAAADILLSGQPLELLDGDSWYIPLRWFNDVYSKLESKTNNAKIFVISVLGTQSSGKSTMLNTMFGLDFPVSAGRCTRGAFASLIPVSDSLKSASNYDYVLIIDTEGLRGSGDVLLRQHYNELATFAIGIADVTIVNIFAFGENYMEMKEFLEIAVHAFLKMKLVKEKKSCKIVHQNVAAPDAIDKLRVDRLKLKQDLDKMTQVAAVEQHCEGHFKKMNDIISFNENEDVFYIPSFLKGSPPMAPVNPEYGRAIQNVKENIISLMCSKSFQYSISQFRERVSNLWNAIPRENFIFSFRNTIEIRAYMSLDRKYFQESVKLMGGMAKLEREIQYSLKQCTTQDQLQIKWSVSTSKIRLEAKKLESEMKNAMNNFFDTNEHRATLEQWKGSFNIKILQEKAVQVVNVNNNCLATFVYYEKLQGVKEMKQNYQKKLLQNARIFINSAHETKDEEACKEAFNKMWQKWIEDVPLCKEKKRNVNDEMVDVLCSTDPGLNTEMTEKLENQLISNFETSFPDIDINLLDIGYFDQLKFIFGNRQKECISAAKVIRDQAVQKGIDFAREISKPGVRCGRNNLTQMYHNVISTIDNETKRYKFKFRNPLKCEILLYTFANTYNIFDEMEVRHLRERDIRGHLEENVRPTLQNYFQNLCNDMEKEVLAAIAIVDVLKKPVESELNRKMGDAVTTELSNISNYQSKGPFHASVLIQLGDEECEFKSYIPYLQDPVTFLKNRLMGSIEKYCLNAGHDLITSVLKNEAGKINKNLHNGILKANELTKTESGKLTFWIQQFVEDCSTLEITKEMLEVAAMEDDLKNFGVFEGKVREDLAQFIETLIERGFDEYSIKKWSPSTHDRLMKLMFGCESCCPFCNSLCDQTAKNHVGKHSTKNHRSLGLNAFHWKNTQVLDIGVCTTYVASETMCFKNYATEGRWQLFKDYQLLSSEYFNSWLIPPDTGFCLPIYWKWFMATFSKELAERYGAKEPEIPEAWKNILFSEVKHQLQQEYNL